MFRYWIVLLTPTLVACDSPTLVSFNTPELCKLHVQDLPTFSQAVERCGDDCVLCIASEFDDQALTYSVSHDDNCVCPFPKRVTRADAGSGSGASSAAGLDAGAAPADAAARVVSDAATTTPSQAHDAGTTSQFAPGSDGCHSRLHLTRSQARTQCSEWDNCRVCVERVDYEGDARSYMAHQCGCPDAYRIDTD